MSIEKNTSKAFNDVSRIDYVISDIQEKLINSVLLDKKILCLGDKYILTVDLIHKHLMMRYWYKENENWKLLKNYSFEDKLYLTANSEGDQEILVECKRCDSKNDFDDYLNIKYEILCSNQITITDFTLVSDDLIVGRLLDFKVEASFELGRTILYKFIKINGEGVARCCQEYSPRNIVSFKEKNSGKYKLLCTAKDIYSKEEYSDRAILNYEILPYKEIKLNGFISHLSSPQLRDTEIAFKAYVCGGKDLLYRFMVLADENIDTGFKRNNDFIWKSKKAGNYKIKLYVKDSSFKDEFEITSEMDFTIEDTGEKPIVIDSLILSKDHKISLGDSIEAKVVASGADDIKYSFILKKGGVIKQKIDYSIYSWAKFIPDEEGTYEIEAMIKDRLSIKEYDSHVITYIQCFGYRPANIDYVLCPSKKYYVSGDTVNLNVVIQNTNEILIKYVLNFNGYKIYETQYTSEKNYTFRPKISGIYDAQIFARNIASYKQFDCKKDVRIFVHDALPVTNVHLLVDRAQIKYGQVVTFTAHSDGGKNVIYEFYLMKDENWALVQKYSNKNFYCLVPSEAGKYKILVLVKSQYNNYSYEDYDIMKLEI